MTEIIANVLRTGEARFNMVGQRLPSGLYDTNEVMSPGLVARLHAYALKALTADGFDVTGWPSCEVYTMDADDKPADRYYCVEFINAKGGRIGLQGIMTRRGWPTLDHGLSIAAP